MYVYLILNVAMGMSRTTNLHVYESRDKTTISSLLRRKLNQTNLSKFRRKTMLDEFQSDHFNLSFYKTIMTKCLNNYVKVHDLQYDRCEHFNCSCGGNRVLNNFPFLENGCTFIYTEVQEIGTFSTKIGKMTITTLVCSHQAVFTKYIHCCSVTANTTGVAQGGTTGPPPPPPPLIGE